MDHDDASRVRGNRANVEVALDRVANLAEPGAQSASYEDESLIHGNSTATSPDLTRAVGDSQAMVSGPDTPAARENSDGHRNSPRKMPRVASSPALPTRATAPRPGSREMRDLFFVRPDAVNFNASYGTPAREVRPRTTDSSRATTFSRTGALTFEENDRSPGNSRLQHNLTSFFSLSNKTRASLSSLHVHRRSPHRMMHSLTLYALFSSLYLSSLIV